MGMAVTLALETGFSMSCSFSGAPRCEAISRKVFSVYFLLSSTRSPMAANARGQKCFGGRKTKAGSGGGLTVRVCLRRREGAISISSCFSKLQGPGSPRRADPLLPAQHLEMATRRGEGWRRSQPCQAETANKAICSAKQTKPFQTSFDLALRVGGWGIRKHLPDPPWRAG